jgi:hypothetical protein
MGNKNKQTVASELYQLCLTSWLQMYVALNAVVDLIARHTMYNCGLGFLLRKSARFHETKEE